MRKVKVLVVDDSALVRAALTKILSSDNEIEVVGTAPDAYIAREKILKLNPDVITLDIEMPGMDGLTFLEKLMKAKPMPVVMVSTCTYANGEKTIKALSLGAIDFVEKPTKGDKIPELSEEIINKVKKAAECSMQKFKTQLILSNNEKTLNGRDDIAKSVKRANTNSPKSSKIILIGASTGGTMAIETILKKLPYDMPGIVIVQHMPANFTRAFAERLDTLSELNVKEAEDGNIVCDNTVYIAPGGKQCYIERVMGHYTLIINDDPPVNRHKPSVDALFLSASEHPCNNVIGVILTGMGKDGAQGMLELRKSGSYNIAQDESTSVVFGMPKEAINIGAANEVLAVDKIAPRLVNLLKQKNV